MSFWGFAFLISAMVAKTSFAATLLEDFGTLDHADLIQSNGVWNVVDRSARAQAFANGDIQSIRPIDFGNGSDGAVNSSNGYVFDTDAHPNGYHFQSLSITGGSISVKGSHPLVIRSLSAITITPPLRVNGARGADGSTNGIASVGGAAVTCLAKGSGGGSASLAMASNGGNALNSNGVLEANTRGLGQVGGSYVGPVPTPGPIESQIPTFTGPAFYDFDTDPSHDFICGTGGAGGGAYATISSDFASGGAGGGGGGILKLVAVGDIQVGVTEAKGGDGGNGIQLSNGACSGSGTAGFGGVIFFQSLKSLSTSVDPDVLGGHSGESPCFVGGHGDMLLGYVRGDLNSASSAPSWVVLPYGSYATEKVPANLQSFVQSKAYDLGVLNASFSEETITSTGTVTMSYAGSSDGVSFSGFSSLNSLNNRGYRFLKWKATFTNPSSGGAAPKISNLKLSYTDLGLSKLDAKLFAGCGTLVASGARSSNRESNTAGILFTLFGICACYGISRLRLR